MRRYFALFFVLMVNSAIAEELFLTYPHQSFSDGYPLALLKMALKKGQPDNQYHLTESGIKIQQGRALVLLSQDIELDVAWSMTSIEREKKLRAIKIPIYKGLFGYRIFLISAQNQHRFSKDMSLSGLQQERLAVQGHDWPDIKVLQHNGFRVEGVEIYDAMFELVEKGRADYFPRSILEVWGEAQQHQQHGLVVEQQLAFAYPAYIFFFVHKNNRALAETIEKGILASIDDGSFDILFDTIENGAIERANLNNRKIIPLHNRTVNSKGVYPWPSLSQQ
ncbi:type 2 periplasmic-binding domain-containing protein [Planctobacterium marinum]|uniref:transporter substrate-binding domain-containing protein n=1 Tax=Planctobacterium marinum TaxID=1631968 RepID=UPI001E540088|nr:transporter substrate-binding domain-containing protein [Planctobacterium marinum]MCC2607567.1 transporter substrate-binding domain-containing protein [Planctobacterium marinum]